MMENETISEIIIRFTDITNSLAAVLEKQYTLVEMVRKVICALILDWNINTVIEEANDLSTLTLENRVENLMTYKVQLQERKNEEQPKKKVLIFDVSSDMKDSYNGEDALQ